METAKNSGNTAINSENLETKHKIEDDTRGYFSTLPAMKHLPELADARPVIVVDTREQTPLIFTRLESLRGTLTSGDYSFTGAEELFAIERKSIQDLVACVCGERERFERELHRLRGFRFARLLVIGDLSQIRRHEYRSNVTPRAVLNSLHAWEARFIPVVFSPTPADAARHVETWAFWFARELVENVNALLRAQRNTRKETTQ